jgi:hypothetical protein
MKYRVYPQKSDVLAMFLARLELAELRLTQAKTEEDARFYAISIGCLKEEIALIQSHGPQEIACEIED